MDAHDLVSAHFVSCLLDIVGDAIASMLICSFPFFCSSVGFALMWVAPTPPVQDRSATEVAHQPPLTRSKSAIALPFRYCRLAWL